jgi:outer membrane protein assembly factor BamB
VARAARLALLAVPALLVGCGASHPTTAAQTTGHSTTAARSTTTTHRTTPPPKPRTDPAWRALRLPRVPPGPVPGYVLVADRNNNRVLLLSPRKKVVWSFSALRGPDDAFFTPGWHSIVTNEEFNDTLRQVALRTRRIVWSYGHAGVPGASPGYLDTPDDAYRLPNGNTTVADIRNCRIVQLTPRGQVAHVWGGSCAHDPPNGFSSPNGDTPLPGGGLLVTEIGGWIDRLDRNGNLLWSVASPVSYPSDAQLLPNGRILVASFTYPGKIVELTRDGRVTWSFGDASGPNLLDKPSLAVRWPNGMIAANDDYGDRVIVIDPRTKRIVWQYGHTGVASAAPGYLSKPDGIDLLPAAVAPAGKPPPAREVAAASMRVTRVGSLPSVASRLAAVALPGGRLLVLGGLVGGSSSTQILAGPPQRLVQVGSLPVATHDDAAVALGRSIYLLGGGQATSSDAVVRVSPSGSAARVGSLGEPLSDLGAAVVGRTAYIAGGYTGAKYATGILTFRGAGDPALAARLPVGLRYAGVAALGGRVYVAGGITTAGTSDAVYAFDPATRQVTRVATLPAPVAHAPLVALGGSLYLVGGDGRDTVLRIRPGRGVTVAGRLPAPLANAAAVASGGSIYVLGGDGSNAVLRLTPPR